MSDVDTKAMRELLAKATPGPYARDPLNLGSLGDVSTADGAHMVAQAQAIYRERPDQRAQNAQRDANADAIVALHNAAPAILDEIEALRAKVEELETQIERMEWDAMGDDL